MIFHYNQNNNIIISVKYSHQKCHSHSLLYFIDDTMQSSKQTFIILCIIHIVNTSIIIVIII